MAAIQICAGERNLIPLPISQQCVGGAKAPHPGYDSWLFLYIAVSGAGT